MSPMTWLGTRTFAVMKSKTSSLGSPSFRNFIGMRRMPSSKSSHPSDDQPAPPISGRCAMEPEKPTSLPLWKIGAAMVMSGRWPEPIQGSFVMMQSPGFHFSIGMRFTNAFSASGSMPTKEGMPAVFSARESPLASIRTVAKSLDSRTIVENEVRSRAAADSSAMEISRLQRISSVTGSKFAFAGSVMGPYSAAVAVVFAGFRQVSRRASRSPRASSR